MNMISTENVNTELGVRSWLQSELTLRCRKNPKYSLRAFARLLGMYPATLSKILAGKRGISAKQVEKICTTLTVHPKQRKLLLASLKTKNVFSFDEVESEPSYRQLSEDAFAIMSDWYHYAILDLTFVEDFRSNPQWIAAALGISFAEVKTSIERLKRLGLLIETNGTLVKTEAFLTNFVEGLTGPAQKQLQRQILHMALDAIDNVPKEEKDITSMTMAIDEKKLPEARRVIKKFRRDICKFLENGTRTRMYHLGVQLYPISKKEQGLS